MARKKSRAEEAATAIDMDALRRAFRKVGADADLAKAILDLAQSSAFGFGKAFDQMVEEHRLAKQHELDMQEVELVLSRDYELDVSDVAKSLKAEIDAGEIKDAEALDNRLRQDIDSTQRVIYTRKAQLGLIASNNSGAYFAFGAEGALEGGDIAWSRLMYAAMERDVVEELERLGVDVNDPQPTDDEEGDD